jgi:hypothetical protein
MAEWLKDHVAAIGSLELKTLVKLETGRDPQVERGDS